MDALLDDLRTLLSGVRLSLEPDGEGFSLVSERGTRRLDSLPLDDIDPAARKAELMAVASGLEAAVKIGADVEDADFVVGAANLLPHIERTRFVTAYASACDDPAARLVTRALGASLSVVYVRDGRWRFHYVGQGQLARWDVDASTLDAGARSNLYHRAEVDYRATEVGLGDGYDAARLLLASDVFYHRDDGDGVNMAIPDRDMLLVDEGMGSLASRFAEARYPLCPYPLRVSRGTVTVSR